MIRNENGNGMKKELIWMKTWRRWTRHLDGERSKMSASCRHLKLFKAHKIRLNEGDQISHNSLNLSRVSFLQFLILNLQEHGTSFYSRRGLKMKSQKSHQSLSNSAPKTSHKESVTWFLLWHLLKATSTPTLYVTWKVMWFH